MNLAVIAFPGNNCEHETARAAKRNGFNAEILRWNDIEKIKNYEAYILPGGFSFEDRGRSGVLASREKIFDALKSSLFFGDDEISEDGARFFQEIGPKRHHKQYY